MLNLSPQDAKLQYIRNWQALQDFGITYFLVKVGRSKKEVGIREVDGCPCQGRPARSFRSLFQGLTLPPLSSLPSCSPGVARHCLQPANPDGPTHAGAEEDMAVQRDEILERQLGVEAATNRPRRGEASLPLPFGRPEDSSRVYWWEHLALTAQRE